MLQGVAVWRHLSLFKKEGDAKSSDASIASVRSIRLALGWSLGWNQANIDQADI